MEFFPSTFLQRQWNTFNFKELIVHWCFARLKYYWKEPDLVTNWFKIMVYFISKEEVRCVSKVNKGLIIFNLQQCRFEAREGGWDVLWQVNIQSGSCLALAEREGKSNSTSVRLIRKVLWQPARAPPEQIPCFSLSCHVSAVCHQPQYVGMQLAHQEVTLAVSLLSASGRAHFCMTSCLFQLEERNTFLSGVKNTSAL